MKKHLMLLKLQIKSAFLAMPSMLAGTVIFGALMVLGAMGAVGLSKLKQDSGELLRVQVVYPKPDGGIIDENSYIKEAFGYFEKIDTVKNVCTFEEADSEAAAVDRLKKGQAAAVIVIPERFISSIINGTNTPIRIIFAESGITTGSSLFREMLRAAAADLSTAQAGVYAMSDVFEAGDFTKQDELKANAYLNARYIAYVIDRNACYETVEVYGNNSLNMVQFYGVTAVILVMLLGTVVCEMLVKPEGKALQLNLKRTGISAAENYLYKIAAVSLLFWLFYGIIYILCSLAVIRYPAVGQMITFMGSGIEGTADITGAAGTMGITEAAGAMGITEAAGGAAAVTAGTAGSTFTTDISAAAETGDFVLKSGWQLNMVKGVLAIFPLVALAFSVAGLVYTIAGKTVSGVIMMFLLSVVMVFSSGCIIPEAMLPEAVAAMGQYLPTAFMAKLCGQILNGTVAVSTVASAAVYSAGLLVVTGIVYRVRE